MAQDTARALRLFLLSAQNGNMKAAVNLGEIFRQGTGVKPDLSLSYMWLQIASDGGEDVGEALRSVSATLGEHALDRARQQARAWRAQQGLAHGASMVASSPTAALSTP